MFAAFYFLIILFWPAYVKGITNAEKSQTPPPMQVNRPLSKFMINLYSKLFLHRLGSKTSSNIDLILPEVCEFNRYKKNSNLGYQQFRKRSNDRTRQKTTSL